MKYLCLPLVTLQIDDTIALNHRTIKHHRVEAKRIHTVKLVPQRILKYTTNRRKLSNQSQVSQLVLAQAFMTK